MLFRFLKVEYNEDFKDYDYENAKYLCAIKHDDYTEYIQFLHFVKFFEEKEARNYGKINFVDDNESDHCYSIADICLNIPKDKEHIESVEVYVYENC